MTRLRSSVFPLFLVMPALVFMVALTIFPTLWSILTSLQRLSLVDLMMRAGRYVGLDNYRTIATDPYFWNALGKSGIFVSISVSGQVVLGVLLASILKNKRIKATGLFRGLFLVPWITTSVIAAYSWIYLLDANVGLVPAVAMNSSFLTLLGLGRRDWLTNPSIAIYALSVVNIWKGTAFSVLMESAGLQSIPDTLYEASEIDGATSSQKFFRITLPLLVPFILVNLVMTTMITFNVYDLLLLMTGGGPNHATEVLSLYIYNIGFSHGEIGYAAALSILLLLVNLAVTIVYLRFLSRRDQ